MWLQSSTNRVGWIWTLISMCCIFLWSCNWNEIFGLGNKTLAETSYLTIGKSISLSTNFPLCISKPVACEYWGKNELNTSSVLRSWKCKVLFYLGVQVLLFLCYPSGCCISEFYKKKFVLNSLLLTVHNSVAVLKNEQGKIINIVFFQNKKWLQKFNETLLH